MRHLLKVHTISFKNAFSGLFWTIKSQPNYKIHLFFSILTLLGGFILNISYYEWLLLILIITLGLVIETINTTIEVTADAIDTSWREDIKIIKDVAAASMLIFSFGAVIIASIIFLPKIVSLF
jgi:diacylglycerol kinase